MKPRRRLAFTLVEVIVVLVILAILAAIAIPALTGYIDKAGTSRVRANAREVIIAAQTLLSEAYADPASSLPTTASTPTDLYVGGKPFVKVMSPDPLIAQGQMFQTLSDSGLYILATDSNDFKALVRTLTNAPLVLADDSSAFFPLVIDDNFNIVGYLYFDPETIPGLSSTTGEGLMVTNNINIVNNIMDYDPTAGVNVWSYNMADGSATKVG